MDVRELMKQSNRYVNNIFLDAELEQTEMNFKIINLLIYFLLVLTFRIVDSDDVLATCNVFDPFKVEPENSRVSVLKKGFYSLFLVSNRRVVCIT